MHQGFFRSKKIWVFSLLILLVAAFLGWGRIHRVGADIDSTYEKLKVLADVLAIVEKNYVEPVNIGKVIQGAINGMLETLDPHSNFMPQEMFKEMQTETRGSFEGLGFEITIRDKLLTVVAPIEDTPAYRAGIQSGDQILRIEGKSTRDMNLLDAVKRLRGPRGTQVTITIMRSGFTEPQDFSKVPVKGLVTMIDLGAKKCIPCKLMAPIMEKMEKVYQGKAAIVFIDVWENREQAGRFGISTIPTQIFFDPKGKEVYRHVGFMSEEGIVAQLKKMGVD